VYVLAAKNTVMGLVLHVSERLRKGVPGMIENYTKNSQHVSGRTGPLLLNKSVADKITDGLGSAGI